MILLELFAQQKSLYVCRPLLNTEDVKQWAEEQGFPSLVDDLHVTIAFSKQPVAWEQFEPRDTRLTVKGGDRRLQRLGDKGALVLRFASAKLHDRWQNFIDDGASWDFKSYNPHLTITYDGADLDLDRITAYDGDLVFGPERFAECDDDWSDKVEEQTLQ